MPTVTTTQSYGSRILGSIKGIGIGFLLFIISFGVLYFNEGRVDLSKVADDAVAVSSEEGVDRSLGQGLLISSAGPLTSDEEISDGQFLKPEKFIEVSRTAEMFAWVEETSETTKTKVGGSTETETTYDYVKKWTTIPSDSSTFQFPEGHFNPAKRVDNSTTTVKSVNLGALIASTNGLSLPGGKSLVLTEKNTNLPESSELIGSEYIYWPVELVVDTDIVDEFFYDDEEVGTAGYATPAVGDLRIKFSILESGVEGTIFGQLNGNKVATFRDGDTTLFRFFMSDAGGALETLHSEYTMKLWIFRLLGFVLMWVGLSMVLGPISVLLDFIPFLGKLSRGLVNFITFVVAFVLSLITIIISAILHSLLAVIVVVVIAVGVAGYFLMKGKKQASAVSNS